MRLPHENVPALSVARRFKASLVHEAQPQLEVETGDVAGGAVGGVGPTTKDLKLHQPLGPVSSRLEE